MAGTQLMRHLAREAVVRELTYTARIFFAEEALAYGFATRLVEDPREAAMATAREIVGRNPDAIRAAKRLLNQAVTCDTGIGLVAETTEQQHLIGGPNQVEALKTKHSPLIAINSSRFRPLTRKPGAFAKRLM
jgi:enoyl-CoA hydratase/carnithine racemase